MPTDGRCDACGTALPVDARFCSACGAAAGGGAPAERRVVTVVFADLAGFTSLAEGLDPETVKDLLDRCFSGLIPVIASHGGTVDKVIGDELMAVFGAPVGHEDDPERAVRAALGLLDQLSSVGSELVLRVGVNTGEVLAGPVGPGLGATVTGDAVNTAHRLVSVALPGEILVGERTWAATADVIAYEERPPYELRGKQAPVRAWSALTVIARAGGDRRPQGHESPLMGRHREMAQLAMVADAAFHLGAAGGPTVAVITGEPGVGKTRLATAFARDIEGPDGVLVLWTTCPAYGTNGGLEPIAELLRSGLAIDANQPPGVQVDQIASRLEAVVEATGTDRSLLTARVAQLLGLHHLPQRVSEPDPGPTRARVVDQLLAAAHTVFAGMAAVRPTMLVLDDVQWADDAVLGFLERLPSRVEPARLLILALGRDELLERQGELARGRAGVVPLPLSPLDPVDAAELLAARLDSERAAGTDVTARPGPIGPIIERRILAAAGGNPLLLEQLVDYLVESGALVRVGGSWRSTSVLDGSGLPDGIRSLIGARLDALPADEHLLVQHAAVVGRRFWADAVAELAGVEDPGPGLDLLLRRGLIESVADDPRPGEFAFRHVLTRDVAYAAISLADRAHRHAQVAHWLRDRFPDDASAPLLGLLAHHYERAVVLSREIERTDPGLAGAAFGALVRAAEEAERREASREAEQWYARALELGTFDHETTLGVTLAHGRVLVDLRRLDEARSAFELVRRRATEPSPHPPRPDGARTELARTELARTATAWQAVAARLGGDGELARELFDQVQAECRAAGDIVGEAETLRLQGRSELAAGRVRAAAPAPARAELEHRSGASPRPRRCRRWAGPSSSSATSARPRSISGRLRSATRPRTTPGD
ncbi:MAG: adenylate/guanylate cyclase domain-containing protein [Acidimicrobiales bacterium]